MSEHRVYRAVPYPVGGKYVSIHWPEECLWDQLRQLQETDAEPWQVLCLISDAHGVNLNEFGDVDDIYGLLTAMMLLWNVNREDGLESYTKKQLYAYLHERRGDITSLGITEAPLQDRHVGYCVLPDSTQIKLLRAPKNLPRELFMLQQECDHPDDFSSMASAVVSRIIDNCSEARAINLQPDEICKMFLSIMKTWSDWNWSFFVTWAFRVYQHEQFEILDDTDTPAGTTYGNQTEPEWGFLDLRVDMSTCQVYRKGRKTPRSFTPGSAEWHTFLVAWNGGEKGATEEQWKNGYPSTYTPQCKASVKLAVNRKLEILGIELVGTVPPKLEPIRQ